MRVIAGSAGGIKLKVPRGGGVRPTSDRVKEALFNILGAWVCNAAVWDLFAGSGAIGIEALSRGAAECVFVERDRRHLGIIKENLARTGLAGRARLICLDVEKALEMLSQEKRQADLIFLDPPYQEKNVPQVLQSIELNSLLREGGLIVLELFARSRLWPVNQPQVNQRRYGDTVLAFIEAAALPRARASLSGN
ncbi:MAG TPA: 16S rRNA (guanine(966)-N(2))-methyltransferase RsmD [Bacillota bacterium]|jgi:16S rRNA (guanine966-N2)-methyltransferase|nr:16S rRNA (guanine(966)-N(2))-methyltransferase RsmD [Bacillota bacterium]HOA36010.1 16S rRNA (guanine(966)-N(2))-methyltransferase RsmD [Bacillota bacterium]HOJ84456.1 16S rRNA (guanine(966)-N(2))-methyltransferase RsmD [Bacillota bacterium]HOL15205.1 16S rRNA (guanine(966)-N(2))-methyltransferase RsmD [Bacillota bacterium]HPZ12111.1 16S rRNA (guanine(966)-N(2))-methyltransferase RsmD [Bacillota bacterium]